MTLSAAPTSATGSMSLIFGNGGGNSYSGRTVVNEGTLNLDGSALGAVVIPAGGLTIVGSPTGIGATTVNENLFGGQIDARNDVTIIGRSTLNMVGNNTFNSLTFSNNGGEGNPTVTNVGVLTLMTPNSITATSSNAATVSTLSGGTVTLPQGVNTFSIGDIQAAGVSYTNIGANSGTVATLAISSIITQAGAGTSIVKTGNGLLQLSGANTFDSGINLTAGGLIIGANSNITTVKYCAGERSVGFGDADRERYIPSIRSDRSDYCHRDWIRPRVRYMSARR